MRPKNDPTYPKPPVLPFERARPTLKSPGHAGQSRTHTSNLGDRTYKLPSDTTSGYGRYVKFLGEPRDGHVSLRLAYRRCRSSSPPHCGASPTNTIIRPPTLAAKHRNDEARRMSDPSHRPSFLARLALLFGSLFLMAAMGEAFLRVLDLFDPFDLQFYSIPDPDEQGVFRTAYGIVRSNSHGYPDAEFDLADSRPRVGYFGDSVTAGVGAGYGHRISEHLEESFPDYQHLTIAKMGDGAQDPEEGLRLVDKFGIDTYVYLMNLNDIMPVVPKPSDSSQKEPAGALRSLSKNSLFAETHQACGVPRAPRTA